MDTQYISGRHEGKTILLDDAAIVNAEVVNCVLLYGGGPLPTLRDSKFDNCEFRFHGPAERTLQFLSMLNYGGASAVLNDIWSTVTKHTRAGSELPEGQPRKM